MKYYLLTLIRVPVNLFPRVFYWKFHYYYFFCSIKSWRNQLWAVAKFCNITVIFSPTSSEHHEFVNVGVNWGLNASKNRIVCLRRAPSFFPLRLAWTCGVSPHTLRLVSPSASCATAHLISNTNTRTHPGVAVPKRSQSATELCCVMRPENSGKDALLP